MGMKVNGTTGLTFPDTTTLASAGQASVRAWVNFNGTGTVAIRASFNVSSITDNGTGLYTVNFTTAMPDANYCVQTTADDVDCATGYTNSRVTPPTTTSVVVYQFLSDTNTYTDALQFSVAIFR